MDLSKNYFNFLKAKQLAATNDRDSAIQMELNLNNIGLSNTENQQRGVLTADPLPDFSQVFNRFGGAPNFGSFVLNSTGNTATSNGIVSNSEQGLSQPNHNHPSAATVLGSPAHLMRLQRSHPAFLTPQLAGIDQNSQEDRLDLSQNHSNGNQLLDSASKNAALLGFPPGFTLLSTKLPSPQNMLNSQISLTHNLLEMLQANVALTNTSSTHNARSQLKRSAPTLHLQSSTPSAPETVTIGAPPLPPFSKRPEPTVASLCRHKRTRYSKGAEDFSRHLLAHNPAGKIDFLAIKSFMGRPQSYGRNVEGVKIPTTSTCRDTHQLQGLPDWTPETAEVYQQLVNGYSKRQFEVEYYIEISNLPVLAIEDQDKRRAEAVEYERSCALYKDPKQSVRSSLFNQYKPGFPQVVRSVADCWVIFKTFHTNSGAKYDEASKKWNEIKAKQGQEYWGWIKAAADLKDEHLRQRKLGYIIRAEKNVRKERKATSKSKKDQVKLAVADGNNEKDDSEIIDVVG